MTVSSGFGHSGTPGPPCARLRYLCARTEISQLKAARRNHSLTPIILLSSYWLLQPAEKSDSTNGLSTRSRTAPKTPHDSIPIIHIPGLKYNRPYRQCAGAQLSPPTWASLRRRTADTALICCRHQTTIQAVRSHVSRGHCRPVIQVAAGEDADFEAPLAPCRIR